LATTRDQGHPAWGRSVGRRAKIEHRRDTGPRYGWLGAKQRSRDT